MNENQKPNPVALISTIDFGNGKVSPAAAILNGHQNVEFSPMFVAGCCVTLYEAFEAHVPEQSQNDFEKYFKELFDKMFSLRSEYVEKHQP
jgi:hypothetical protein